MTRTSQSPFSPELRTRLCAEFPSLRPRDLEDPELIGEGWCTTAYRVGTLAVRVPRLESCTDRLTMEPRLVAALEAAGVPFVPRGMRALHAEDGRVLATTHEAIEGRPAREVLRPPRGRLREELARDIGVFLGALHAFPANEARRLGVPERDLWSEQYAPFIETSRPYLADRTLAWMDSLAARFVAEGGSAEAPRVLVHGDVDGRNVLVRDRRLAGVIDYGDAMVADPAIDFACILNDWSWSFLERVLAHYPLPVDADARRRTTFYITIGPLFDVVWGAETDNGPLLRAGSAKLAARARVREGTPTG